MKSEKARDQRWTPSTHMKPLTLLLALSLTACGGGGGSSAPSKCVADFYADSIGSGDYQKVEGNTVTASRWAETPAQALQRLRPSVQVNDYSLGSMSFENLVNGVQRDDVGYVPPFASRPRTGQVVIVENGVIDAINTAIYHQDQQSNLEAFEARIRAVVAQIRSEGRTPVLTGFARQAVMTDPLKVFITPEAVDARNLFDAKERALANELGVVFAGYGDATFRGVESQVDVIHPTKEYSNDLVQQLAYATDIACLR